jgi:hypothetical protein
MAKAKGMERITSIFARIQGKQKEISQAEREFVATKTAAEQAAEQAFSELSADQIKVQIAERMTQLKSLRAERNPLLTSAYAAGESEAKAKLSELSVREHVLALEILDLECLLEEVEAREQSAREEEARRLQEARRIERSRELASFRAAVAEADARFAELVKTLRTVRSKAADYTTKYHGEDVAADRVISRVGGRNQLPTRYWSAIAHHHQLGEFVELPGGILTRSAPAVSLFSVEAPIAEETAA